MTDREQDKPPQGTTHWSREVYNLMARHELGTLATVPDAGLTELIALVRDDPDRRLLTLSTEEEGVGIMTGLWIGGKRGLLAMQSSGVGNCMNALSLTEAMRAPLLMLVTMRGQWGEFNPWQNLMGQTARRLLETVGVTCFEVVDPADIGKTFDAAAAFTFNGGPPAAVLISQRALGRKEFKTQ